MYSWKNTDPRLDINKRAYIVIIRPVMDICTAHVDTKEVYCIFTDFDDCKVIGEKSKWNQDWQWIWGPHKGVYDWCPWKNTDPRLSLNNDASIVIVRPAKFGAGLGQIKIEHDWSIILNYEDHKLIDADEEWNQDWWWIFGPS